MKKLETTVALALVAIICFQNSECAKINTPRVLLPWFENMYVNFTFEIIEGGCYTWSLSRDDIIDIEPLYEDSWGQCSRAARVSVSKRASPPGTVIILAEEVNTGEILRGDVDIDVISHIKVMSTTWKLYLEEAPEAFEVVAYDDQGNTFSTLDGISFDWSIKNIGNEAGESAILSLVHWRDTDYEAPVAVSNLEALGLRSYNVLLYGQAMGECQVSVCLNKICTDFTLNVVASVVLMPSTATIAPGDTLKYRVVRARAGRLTVQEVADTLYHLRLPDSPTASLEDHVSTVRAGTVGTTHVALKSGATEVATAVLHVTEPHSVKVTIRPSSPVIRGEEFLIHCVVLDVKGSPLMSGDATLVRLTVDGSADVDLLRSNENGTYTYAAARSAGPLMVDARLYSVAGRVLSTKVEGHATAVAVEPLEVAPRELYVAWTDGVQEIQLQHRGGGDEPVTWSGDGVTSSGVLTVRAPARLDVLVHLTQHSHVSASGRVYTLPADYMQLSSSGVARVGRPHHLHVALTGTHPDNGELFNFHRCDCASFTLTLLEGPEPFNVTAATNVEPMEGACCVISATWQSRGATAVRAARGRLGAAARLSVRAAPRVLWPERAAALVGATLPVIALGEALSPAARGPAATLTPRASPPPRAHADAQMFTMHCVAKGDSRLELVSQVDDEIESVELEAACAPHVTKIRLDPPELQGNCSAGPRLWLRPNREARLYVTLLDAAGRELLDERGPKVAWTVHPAHAGVGLRASDRLFIETRRDYEPVTVPHKYYQIVVADELAVGWSGALKATAPDAQAAAQATVVAPLHVAPLKVNIAWESESIANVATVRGGSGRYHVTGTSGATARVTEGGSLGATVPGVGVYEFVVSDACAPDERVTVEVNIEEILSVEVSAARAVCVGSCVPVAALVRGVSYRYLQSGNEPEWAATGGATVRGGRLCGVAEGAASVRASHSGVWSDQLEVLVYPPLSIEPPTVRLPPRARVQLRARAGPPPRLASLHYELKDGGGHVEISSSGLVHGVSAGAARVRLVARDADGAEMTSAEADVEVIPVTGVRAHASTPTLLVGAPAALWVSAERLAGAALAALPGARVAWAARTPARLYAGIADDKIERSTVEGLTVRVVPLEPGPVVIDVKIKNMGQLTESRTWEKTVELLAVDDVRVTVDGRAAAVSCDRVAVAVGATVRLKSAPRSEWVALGSSDVFTLSANGELTALKPGFGVVVARHRDEKNNVYRETAVHIESSIPHYVTAQPSGDAIELVLRNSVGRELLAPGTNVSASRDYSTVGSKLVLTGSEAGLATFRAAFGGLQLEELAWLDGPDQNTQRVVATPGLVICLAGGGWRGPAGASLHAGAGAAACAVRTRGALTLRAAAPERRVDVHVLAVEKLEFIPGDWPPHFVPLHVTAARALTPTCDAALAAALSVVDVPPVHQCRAAAPHSASAVVRLERGELGCALTPAHPITDAADAELCAELDSQRACTTVPLLPPLTVSTDAVSLLDPPAVFTVSGHARAMRAVELTPSPGLRFEQTARGGEITVTVVAMDTACGEGWVRVQCSPTAQDVRVRVRKDCEVACGTILGALVALLRPYLATVVTFVAMAAAYFYVQSRLTTKAPITFPSPPHQSVLPPAEPGSPLVRSTWSRSPYSPRGPASPVYGDTTILPDQSFSPHAARMHSSFL